MINDGDFKTSVPVALLFQYVIKKNLNFKNMKLADYVINFSPTKV